MLTTRQGATGREAVARDDRRGIRRAHRYRVDQQPDPPHQVADIGEVAPHVAVIVDVDRAAFQDRPGELEIGHVGPAPGPVDGEEAEQRDGEAVDMRPGMGHRLVRLLGRGIERHLGVDLVGLGIGHLGVGAVDRRGRGHQEVPDARRPRHLHHVEGADQVGVDIDPGVVDGVAHPGLGGEMDDDLGARRGAGRREAAHVLEPADRRGEAGEAGKLGVARLFQRDVVIVGKSVIARDRPALLEQEPAEVIADEPGRAGDERAPHGPAPFRSPMA